MRLISFNSLSKKQIMRAFWVAFALVVLITIVFGFTGIPLNTDAAPSGIISFELAGSAVRVEEIFSSWDSSARERAAFNLGLDFLFIPAYVSAVIIGIHLAAEKVQGRFSAWCSWLTGGVFLAGLLDIIENIALLTILFQSPTAPWPIIAKFCAIPKFTLIFMGIIYALMGAVSKKKV